MSLGLLGELPLHRIIQASDNDGCHRNHIPQAISSMMSHRPQEAHREPLPLDHKDPGARRERVHIIETSAKRVEKSPKFRHVLPRGVRSFWIAWARGRSSCTSDHGVDPLVVMALAHYQFETIHPDPLDPGSRGGDGWPTKHRGARYPPDMAETPHRGNDPSALHAALSSNRKRGGRRTGPAADGVQVAE